MRVPFCILITVIAVYSGFDPSSRPLVPRPITHTASTYNDMASADMDGDGDIDLITAADGPSPFTLHENRAGGLHPHHLAPQPSGGVQAPTGLFITIADFTGDGLPDILGANKDNRILLFVNRGELSFITRRIAATYKRITGLFSADIDGDGDMDAGFIYRDGSQYSRSLALLENRDGLLHTKSY
ncbi:MAG: FG-GAP repeat domain-containing protein, partial [Fibrobacterota bacterium]